MDRYSELYGTLAGSGGIYSPVKTSANLPKFMSDVGAVNPTATGDAVRKILSGFESKEFDDNYLRQPNNKLPVAVRYAPMHLYKRADMPKSMEPFCALCVNGNENKQDTQDNRVTYYAHTFYIARAHMHETVTVGTGSAQKSYNYLDQIFGTHLLTHQEVAAIRAGKASLDSYELPEKVNPKMRPQDAAVVFNAVGAVFDEKVVVIRLEKGCSFNDRAWELLIPIYALMPPRLATETGFATYQSLSAIRAMTTDTSMRIFVVPAECKLDAVSGGDMVVLDLATPGAVPAPQKGEFRDMLMEWYKLPWEQRQIAMEKVFGDTATTYQDKALFTQRSQEFFTMLTAWKKGEGIERGAIATLEELKAKYDANPLFAQIPWLKESFVSRVPTMLKKGVTLTQLTTDALALALCSKDENEKKHAQQMYLFAADLAAADTIKGAQAVGKMVKAQTKEEDAQELTQVKTAAAAAIAAEQAKTAQAIADGEAAAAKAVAAGEEKCEQIKKAAAEKIRTERDAHEATKTALSAEQQKSAGLEEQLQTTQATLSAEQTAHQATQQQLSDANARIEKAKTAYVALKQESDGYKDQIDSAKAEAAQAVSAAKRKQSEAEQAKADADKARAEAEAARAKADKTIQENNKRMVIFAAAGFLVAALIFGVIMLIMGLSGNKDAVETSDPSASASETTLAPTDESTEPSTEETTEATTEATEPSVPDLTNWSDDTAALWLTDNVAGIDQITLEPTGVPEELETIEGYAPVAMIQLAGGAEDYAVLLQKSQTEEEPGDSTDEPLPADETDPTDETEGEESGQPVEMNARVLLTAEDFVLAVYGSDDAVVTGLEIFAQIVDETQTVASNWNLDGAEGELHALLSALLGDEQWWRTVTAVSTERLELEQAMILLGTESNPVMYLKCGEERIFLYEELLSFEAQDLAETLTEAGHTAQSEGALVAAIPGE